MTVKYCEGCKTYRHITSFKYSCARFNLDDECPCSECIIKMICQDSCSKYYIWMN